MIRKGFTLIELLVVIVIISILITLALPNYMKARDKAKEAQVKAGGHIIKTALERYGVDFNGSYPLVVAGGDPYFNLLSMNLGPWTFFCGWNPMGLSSPLADHYHSNDTRTFQRHDGCTDREWCIDDGATLISTKVPGLPSTIATRARICMDSLLLYNYLSQYPANPFVRADRQGSFAPWSPYGGYLAYGGYYGNLMWDLGLVHGEWPWLDFWVGVDPSDHRPRYGPPNLDLPGNFYYHPIFCDGQPVATHKWALVDYNGNDGSNSSMGRMIFSHEVCGYILTLFGSTDTRGYDANHCAMSNAYGWVFFDGTGIHVGPSGYFSNEPDPIASQWVGSGQTRYCTGTTSANSFSPFAVEAGDETGPQGSGPDGVPDYYIAILHGGLDFTPKLSLGTKRE